MDKDKLRNLKMITKDVGGWLTDNEAKFLFNTSKNCSGKGVIVEIGSWKGKSTIWISKGSKENQKLDVYAIDPHTGSIEHNDDKKRVWTYDEFKNNIKNAGVDNVVVPIVMTSLEAVKSWNKPIEFLFIDGSHEYEDVKEDFLSWFPYLVDGGIIALHDTTMSFGGFLPGWPGPKKVVNELIFRSNKIKDVGFVDTITYGRKCKKRSSIDNKNMRMVRLKKLLPDTFLSFYWTLSKLPKPMKKFGKKILGK